MAEPNPDETIPADNAPPVSLLPKAPDAVKVYILTHPGLNQVWATTDIERWLGMIREKFTDAEIARYEVSLANVPASEYAEWPQLEGDETVKYLA